MADSDQAIRDIVAQLQNSPTDAEVASQVAPAPALVGVMPGPEITPAMTTMLPTNSGAAPQAALAPPLRTINVGDYQMPQYGNQSQYDLPAPVAPQAAAGPPLVITPPTAAAPARVARAAGDDWAPPAISMTPPPIAQVPAGPVMGRLAAIQRPTVAVPALASILGTGRQ